MAGDHHEPLSERLRLRLSPSPAAPAAARGALGPLRGAVEAGMLGSVELLVSELVTNAIRHGDLREDDWIELLVEASEDSVWVGVADPGRGFRRFPNSPRADHPSGWGLYLVNHLADRWGVERKDKTLVWFEVRRGPPRADDGEARPSRRSRLQGQPNEP